MKKTIVSPSLLSADFKNLLRDIKKVDESGAEWLHFDVMDGHFVPNISFGIPVLKDIYNVHNMLNDVHIMVSDPLTYGPLFAKNGADLVTFHYEAMPNKIEDIIIAIRNQSAKVGISIKPNTPVELIYPYLNKVDLVLVMSVEPGFGGQSFIEDSLNKISSLRKYIDDNKLSCLIEVDGGINDITGTKCKEAGADVLVAGSYLFGHDDIKERISALKE